MIVYTVDFVEFPSSSATASRQFFEQAFGWAATSYGPDYTDVQGGGVALGSQADDGDRPSVPLVTIRTDDLVQARKAIERAG
jgi:predicted enzyme related to lactoylglutathione lyase